MAWFGKKKRERPLVLHVDDSTVILRQAAPLIEEAGYDLVTATSGKAAIAEAGKSSPDIILLDLTMPDMDGFETLAALKSNSSLKNIPVIIATATDSVSDIDKAYSYGAKGYIVKPFKSASQIKKALSFDSPAPAPEKAAPAPERAAPSPAPQPPPAAPSSAPAPALSAAPPLREPTTPEWAQPKGSRKPPLPVVAAEPKPSVPPPLPTPAPSARACPQCGAQIEYSANHRSDYCTGCCSYHGDSELARSTRCAGCGQQLSYIAQYSAWYCYRCKSYPFNS